MITCPQCSAQNDPSNRFCDQCGYRLEGLASSAPAAPITTPADAAAASQPTAPAMNCPSCGAAVLPGEAFCDVCGASLQGAAPVAAPSAAPDAPTVLAPLPAGEPMTSQAVAPSDAPTADTPAVPPPTSAPPATDATVPPVTPASEQPAPPPAAPPPAAGGDAERQRLEELIATQEKLIAQMEQMQAMFGAATPPAILDGLKQARETRDKAQADLQALPPPKPAVDPAEVARLEELIATQEKLIAQMEQMQAMFGAATPPAILDGLKQARETRDKAQADLQSLTGGAAPTPATPAPAPAEVPTPAPTSTPAAGPPPQAAPPVQAQPTPQPAPQPVQPQQPAPPVQPPVAPPSAGPRLVIVEGGKELSLPTDKAEIIIGREDPISQIFPEVDLTPFGGETGGVSRQHARISHANGQWTVTDLNSTNYTRVDGVKIDPQVPVPIRDGARIQFGRIATVFHAG